MSTKCPFCSIDVTKQKVGKHIINKHLDTIFTSSTDMGLKNRKNLDRAKKHEPLVLQLPNNEVCYACFVCNNLTSQYKFAQVHTKPQLNKLKTTNCFDKQDDVLEKYRLLYPVEENNQTVNQQTIEDIQNLFHRILDDMPYETSARFTRLQKQGINLSKSHLESLFGKIESKEVEEVKEDKEEVKEDKEEIKEIIKEEVQEDKEEVQEDKEEIKEIKEEIKEIQKPTKRVMKRRRKLTSDEEKDSKSNYDLNTVQFVSEEPILSFKNLSEWEKFCRANPELETDAQRIEEADKMGFPVPADVRHKIQTKSSIKPLSTLYQTYKPPMQIPALPAIIQSTKR